MELICIAKIENGFESKFGIPRQSGISSAISKIIFEPRFRVTEAVRSLESFSHIWLIWGFSEGFASSSSKRGFCPTVRPPRLGGNLRVGVFATRSPNRPNPLGLSVVKLVGIKTEPENGTVLLVTGADMMNGTPIYDIKPYLPFADAVPDATGGFAEDVKSYSLGVVFEKDVEKNIIASGPGEKIISEIKEILSQDPRPSYQNDPERVYLFDYSGWAVGFRVENGTAVVTKLERL